MLDFVTASVDLVCDPFYNIEKYSRAMYKVTLASIEGGSSFCRSSRSSWRSGPSLSDQMAFYWWSSVDQIDANSAPSKNEEN